MTTTMRTEVNHTSCLAEGSHLNTHTYLMWTGVDNGIEIFRRVGLVVQDFHLYLTHIKVSICSFEKNID